MYQTLLVRKQCFMGIYIATSSAVHTFWHPDGVWDHFPRVQKVGLRDQVEVVAALLEAFPGGASVRDNHGKLALRRAAESRAPAEVLQLLRRARDRWALGRRLHGHGGERVPVDNWSNWRYKMKAILQIPHVSPSHNPRETISGTR